MHSHIHNILPIMELKFMTYNATGITTAIPYIAEELNSKRISIMGISEHWLLDHNANILNTIDRNYISHTVTCSTPRFINGHAIGKGGVALLWHQNIDKNIEIVQTGSDRAAAVRFSTIDMSIMVIQVYLPTANNSFEYFKEEIDNISHLCAAYSEKSHIVIMGDFNAQVASIDEPETLNRTRDIYLNKLIQFSNLVIASDSSRCSGAPFTFYPYSNGRPSRIDHILMDRSLVHNLQYCHVLPDAPLNVSRHFPVLFSLHITESNNEQIKSTPLVRKSYSWNKRNEVSKYSLTLRDRLESSYFDYADIDAAAIKLAKCIIEAADLCLPRRNFKKYLKPYWTKTLKDLHKQLKASYTRWCVSGKVLNSLEHVENKRLKRLFRRELRGAAHAQEDADRQNLDTLAETDQTLFWKCLQARTPKTKKQGCEIAFAGTKETTVDGLLRGWRTYFQELYTFAEDKCFDSDHRLQLEQRLPHFLNPDAPEHDTLNILRDTCPDEIKKLVEALPNNKSASSDNITYEHLKHGGPVLISCISKLFNAIIKTERFPVTFKAGLTVTIYKGNGKPYSDPSSYRAISLLPVMSKLFEKLLMLRFEETSIRNSLNGLQHGFQKGMNCKMVSFIVQEVRNYCWEHDSPLNICYLDARSAFDMVWLNGLLYKLHELGIRGKPLRLISNSFNGCSSRVLLNGRLSEPYEIEQGTRQGSICAPFYYTIFIDALLHELQSSSHSIKIGSVNIGAPTQADDVVLLAHSRKSLNELLRICYRYANKWRYLYNPTKCAACILRPSRSRGSRSPQAAYYGNSIVPETEAHRHLGITQSADGKQPSDVDAVKSVLKASFISITSRMTGPYGVNPSSAMKIYNACVLPRALFGCELWNSISYHDMQQLETAHRFCLKRAQNLPISTRTDMVTSLLGATSLEVYIDLTKLSFLGLLCRVPAGHLVRQLLLHRFFQLRFCSKPGLGFIPDIVRILHKYNLQQYSWNIPEPNFPSRTSWKRICKAAVYGREESAWKARMDSDADFGLFREVQTQLRMSSIWSVAKVRPDSLPLMKLLAKCCCQRATNASTECRFCSHKCSIEIEHLMFECTLNDNIRKLHSFQNNVALINIQTYNFLNSVPKHRLVHYIFGRIDDDLTKTLDVDTYPNFMIVCANLCAELLQL